MPVHAAPCTLADTTWTWHVFSLFCTMQFMHCVYSVNHTCWIVMCINCRSRDGEFYSIRGYWTRQPVCCLQRTSQRNNQLCGYQLHWEVQTSSYHKHGRLFLCVVNLAIACHLSVCLSVCLSVTLVHCAHIGWNSSEIISPLVSLGCSLSAHPNIRGLLQGEHPEILAQIDPPHVDLSVGDIWSQIAAEWLQIAQRSQWRAYRKLSSLFLMVPLLTSYDLPFPHMGSICPKICE